MTELEKCDYTVWDESGTRVRIRAGDETEAAEEYVRTGDWPAEVALPVTHTVWVCETALMDDPRERADYTVLREVTRS